MYISKTQFYIITFLFFLLPFSMHWRLFLFGKRTTGIVIKPNITDVLTLKTDRHSIICFETPDRHIYIYGPEDVIYPVGKEIKIIYRENKPEDYVMLNAAGLLLTNKTVIPFVLLIFWVSFYVSYRQTHKKQHKINYSEKQKKSVDQGKKAIR